MLKLTATTKRRLTAWLVMGASTFIILLAGYNRHQLAVHNLVEEPEYTLDLINQDKVKLRSIGRDTTYLIPVDSLVYYLELDNL